MSSSYEIAKQEGYSDEEIQKYFSKKIPDFQKKFQEARQQDYEANEIYDFLSKQSQEKSKTQKGIELAPGQRQLGQFAARGVETALGMPRQAAELLEQFVPEKLIKKGASKIGLGKPVEKGLDFAKEHAPYKLLPKKEDIREFGKTLFGKTFEPQSDMERLGGDIAEDFTALALPIFGGPVKVLKPLLAAIGGNVAKDMAVHFGKSETAGDYLKLGTTLAISLVNPKGAENLKNELYAKARNARKPDAKVDAFQLRTNVRKYKNELSKGGSASYKTESLKKLDEIEKAASTGDIEVEELEKFKIAINSLRSGLYEEFKGNKSGRKLAKAALDRVSKIVDNGLEVYKHSNPEWYSFYRPANEVHGAIEQSKKWGNFIKKNAIKFATPGLASLFGITHFGGIGPAAIAAGVGFGSFKAGELAVRVWKSPHLRKLYTDAIKDAGKRNIKSMNENLKKLDVLLENQ